MSTASDEGDARLGRSRIAEIVEQTCTLAAPLADSLRAAGFDHRGRHRRTVAAFRRSRPG